MGGMGTIGCSVALSSPVLVYESCEAILSDSSCFAKIWWKTRANSTFLDRVGFGFRCFFDTLFRVGGFSELVSTLKQPETSSIAEIVESRSFPH